MAVAEILTTKKECFTVFENGCIHMTKGKFIPSRAPIHDVYPKPEKPELGPVDWVEHNIWGEEIFRENENILLWRVKCSEIDRINKGEHKKQEKAFKRRLIEVRRNYHRQEAERRHTEKSERTHLIKRQGLGVRAYLARLLQHQK